MKDLTYNEWLPYDTYEKNECDIKLHDGTILKHYYPNAGDFHACCDLKGSPFEIVEERDVAEIMYRNYYMEDICTNAKHMCNGVPKKRKHPIGTIGHIDHGKTTLTAAIVAAAKDQPITITGRGTVAKEPRLEAPGIEELIQPYNGPKPVGNLEQTKNEWAIMKDEQTPMIPQMEIDVLLGHKEILHDFLIHASKDYPTGIGLAANQVGIWDKLPNGTFTNLNRFMLPVFAKKNRETGEWSLILNPVIIHTEGILSEKKEYCLTWPGKVVVADRHYSVTVSYYDIEGEEHEVTTTGFEAQIWQHEINHLLGIDEVVVNSAGGIEHSKEPGRNDPCLCGSGKKYKKCCRTTK